LDWLLMTCLLGNEASSWVLSMFKISYLVIGKSAGTIGLWYESFSTSSIKNIEMFMALSKAL
jgi:hypothetical protein